MKHSIIVFLLILSGEFYPSNTSTIVWNVIEHSKLYSLLRPFENEIKLYSSQVDRWDIGDYRETILLYYKLTYNSILHNELEKTARYCGILLALILRLKASMNTIGKLVSMLDTVDWDKIRIYDLPPEEIIDLWLSKKFDSLEELLYSYASVVLSLLDKMPVDSFVRILYTPYIRELYLASFISIVVASTYFVYKKSLREGGEIEIESPP